MIDFVSSFGDLRAAFPDRTYEGAEFVLADVPLHPRAAELVPPWMRLDREPLGTLVLARYDRPSYTEPYRLAALLLHVKTLVGEGVQPFDPLGSLIAGDPMRVRFVTCDVLGLRYLLPVGLAGPGWFIRTFRLRYR